MPRFSAKRLVAVLGVLTVIAVYAMYAAYQSALESRVGGSGTRDSRV